MELYGKRTVISQNYTIPKSIAGILFLIILPLIGFFYSAFFIPEYKSENSSALSIMGVVVYSWSFLPLYFFSLGALFSDFGGQKALKRAGLWSGVIFGAIQFFFVLNLLGGGVLNIGTLGVVLWMGVAGIGMLLLYFFVRFVIFSPKVFGKLLIILPLLFLVVVIISAVVSSITGNVSIMSTVFAPLALVAGGSFYILPGVPLFFIVFCLFYLWSEIKEEGVLSFYEPMVPVGFSVVAWKISFELSLKAYQMLPDTPPPSDCYIATAASKGHQHLVGTREVVHRNGVVIRVNKQLQQGKLFELYLKARFPRIHRGLRKIYDFVGPKVARRVHSQWAADLAFYMMKPWEIMAKGVLSTAVPEYETLAESLYIGERIE